VGPPEVKGTYRTYALRPVPTTWFAPLPITSPILWDQMGFLGLATMVPKIWCLKYLKPYRGGTLDTLDTSLADLGSRSPSSRRANFFPLCDPARIDMINFTRATPGRYDLRFEPAIFDQNITRQLNTL